MTVRRLADNQDIDFTFDDKDKKISLRFDLSAPLARVVSEKYLEFAFPFRRFQIAEVFRNETSKTGRGRYRSFVQGDFDQIFYGKVPPQANAEILQIICDTMFDLKFKKDQFKNTDVLFFEVIVVKTNLHSG